VRVLHTGDWHLGKVLRGRSRLEEQTLVLGEIVTIVEQERIELVLVAGDLFESSAPPPEAQRLAWTTLLALRQTGAQVVVVSGNHDNAHAFEAVRPVFGAAGITVVGALARPEEGGVLSLGVGSEQARIALLPWLFPRQLVRAAQLFEEEAAELSQAYADRVHRVLGALTTGFGSGTPAVDLVLAHAFVRGGVLGGGERDAQTVNDYGISATAFPASASYVALGHLHRTQRIAGPCPIWYSGSPIAVDFGEQSDAKQVLIIEARPGRPAVVEERRLSTPVTLRTVTGTLAELTERAADWAGELLRVIVTEANRAGLANDVRQVLPDALEVRIQRRADGGQPSGTGRHERTPLDSFAAYLEASEITDRRLVALFGELLADEHSRSTEDVG
jgi:exonuclease SbcD